MFLNTLKLDKYSPQQLLDCMPGVQYYGGCNENPDTYDVLDYIQVSQGLASEKDYPFIAVDESCRLLPSTAQRAKLNGFSQIKSDPYSMADIVLLQPIVAEVSIQSRTLLQYKEGILDDAGCGTFTEHKVLIVGWGVEQSGTVQRPYWIVKNCWGSDWGELGYARILITKGSGICGINKMPVYAY